MVVAAGRQARALEKIAEDCRERAGQPLAAPTDTTREDQVRALAQRAVEAFGRIDVCVNNAAVTAFGTFDDAPPDVFRRVVETDFFGYGARAVLPIFREQARGILINAGSVVSYVSQPYSSAYVCSKHAIRALSECLRTELALENAPSIHVCTVLPSTIDTPIFQRGANFSAARRRPCRRSMIPRRSRAILVARPQREVFVGSTGRVQTLMHALVPALAERIGARQVDRRHFQDRPATKGPGNVFKPVSSDLELRGARGARAAVLDPTASDTRHANCATTGADGRLSPGPRPCSSRMSCQPWRAAELT